MSNQPLVKRPGKFVDRVGQRFGRLTVVSYYGPSRYGAQWWCHCDCGEPKVVTAIHLTKGFIASCGCLQRESRITHGATQSREYQIWSQMVQRCTNPKIKCWADYGGRGITIDPRWLKFENFYADMGPRPTGLTMERKDNEQGYWPWNCVWATRKEQQSNRRVSKK